MNELSENIAILRKQNKMSQSDLANILYVTPQAISRWERGETEPDVDTIKKLAEVFKVSVEEIIYGPISKFSKKLRKIMHISYFIFSIVMVVLSILTIVLVASGFSFIKLLYIFTGIAGVYFIFLMICEIIQTSLKNKPVHSKEASKETTKQTK